MPHTSSVEFSGALTSILLLAQYSGQLFTSEDDQTEAPVGVPHSASPEQHLVVVQRVGLSVQGERSSELVQTVVGRLAPHFT